MSREEVIEFKCDVCGKIHRHEYSKSREVKKNPFRSVFIPSKGYDCEGKSFDKSISNVDMCEDCFNEYWDYVQSRYDVSDCYDIKVEIKGGM